MSLREKLRRLDDRVLPDFNDLDEARLKVALVLLAAPGVALIGFLWPKRSQAPHRH